MPLSLQVDPKYLDGDIVLAERNVAETEALIALCTDARVDGALVPAGQENRGYWVDVFEREPLGSHLWLYENDPADLLLAPKVEDEAKRRLKPIIAEGRITRVATEELLDGQHLDLVTRLWFPDGSEALLGPVRVT